MAVPAIQNSFITGEIAPSIFGRQDLARYHTACSTMRNFWPSYRGPAYSRAGTKFVGFSKQTGSTFPPRVVPFQFSINQGLALEFGHQYMRVISNGAFVTESPIAISGITRTNPALVAAVNSFNNDDWVFITGVVGMTQVNNQIYRIGGVNAGQFNLFDAYHNPIDATGFSAYVGGGTVARVFTLNTVYNQQDLAWLKFTQSADVMSICCVNQQTGVEYQAQDLARFSDTNWQFTPVIAEPSVSPPTGVNAETSGGGTTTYQYVVTAVSPTDGTESIASNIVNLPASVDVAATAGTITVFWNPVTNVTEYNVYKATPALAGAGVPVGALFGYAGSAYGTQFLDTNIVADLTQVPPSHNDPFARGVILAANVTNEGSGYTDVTYTINTTTGSGAVLEAVVLGGLITGFIIQDQGHGYAASDTVTITGNGVGGTANLSIGPQSGTYPSTVGYFQQRRAYANTLNNPDTYFMSQPGAYTNFDARVPTIATDAITGTPWAVQVNGVQWMIPTSGGLLVMTGLRAWLLAGVGSFATNVQPISPSNQDAIPQAFSGCSATIPPIVVNYDVLYVEAKGSRYYDLPYQLYALSEPIDLTEVSSHLFTNFSIKEHAWCEQPNKLLWSVRSDGVMLSLTYYKTQQVAGFARHDTNGFFESVCSVVEPPVDALYMAVQRFPGAVHSAYMIERMDNRLWTDVESSWCVDCGLSLLQPKLAAAMTISSSFGLGAISGVTNLVGGANWSPAASAQVIDQAVDANANPIGSGAVPTLTIVAGVITAITFAPGSRGTNYQQPMITFSDPAGSAGGGGASATLTLDNTATVRATAPVFSAGMVGRVIRASGGIALITGFTDAAHLTVNILSPFTATIPNSGGLFGGFAQGIWTVTAPVTTISGLNHLIGSSVTGLADGNVIAPQVVSPQGTITLPVAASAVTVGLGFQAQMQGVPLDAGQPTVQGQRKKIAAVTVRLEASRGAKCGTNQQDGSTLSPAQLAPTWNLMHFMPDQGAGTPNFPAKPYNALAVPLRTGDVRIPVSGGWGTPGQVAVQQDLPLPCQVLSFIPEVLTGDTPQMQAPPKGKSK